MVEGKGLLTVAAMVSPQCALTLKNTVLSFCAEQKALEAEEAEEEKKPQLVSDEEEAKIKLQEQQKAKQQALVLSNLH
jgi:hypothetical protein